MKNIYQWWRLDEYGYPMEYEIGRPIRNLIRLIFMNIRKVLKYKNLPPKG